MEERIILENVSKKFYISHKKSKTALEKIISIVSKKETKKELEVLKNVSFKLNAGENLGIIGRNGSGKSTLLRIIAGIYNADSGIVKTNGKIICLNGLVHGLNHKLTMSENIYLAGSIMDLSQKDINEKFNEIVEFSGLKEFIDTKVQKFSSGMVMRLGFSITIHCLKHSNPDILLLDEFFLSVGDEDFNKKAIAKIEDFIRGGATIILISHDMNIIRKYCDRVILIDKGMIIKEGGPDEVIKSYLHER